MADQRVCISGISCCWTWPGCRAWHLLSCRWPFALCHVMSVTLRLRSTLSLNYMTVDIWPDNEKRQAGQVTDGFRGKVRITDEDLGKWSRRQAHSRWFRLSENAFPFRSCCFFLYNIYFHDSRGDWISKSHSENRHLGRGVSCDSCDCWLLLWLLTFVTAQCGNAKYLMLTARPCHFWFAMSDWANVICRRFWLGGEVAKSSGCSLTSDSCDLENRLEGQRRDVDSISGGAASIIN